MLNEWRRYNEPAIIGSIISNVWYSMKTIIGNDIEYWILLIMVCVNDSIISSV